MEILTEESEIINIVKETEMQHVAIIMDGNRRWAKQRHLPSAIGHQKGVTSLKNTMRACDDFGIKYLTVYAFSTENWNRTEEEVNFLMGLLAKTIKNELMEMHENGVKITFIGNIKGLNQELQDIVKEAEETTKDNQGVNLQIAFNYGSRMEITNACKLIAEDIKKGLLQPEEITEDTVNRKLYTYNIPNPDLLIRTGGEKRISNYLLWQSAYSEIYVTDLFWPEFGKKELAEAVKEYAQRTRRFGK